MTLVVSYMDVGKGFRFDNTTYNVYGVMFDPNFTYDAWDEFSAINTFSSVSLLGFQQGLEVCVCCVLLNKNGGSPETPTILFGFEQYKDGSWQEKMTPFVYTPEIEDGDEFAYRTRVGVDPDEIRPDYSSYRFYFSVNGNKTYKSFGVTNLSFDTTPHPAGYVRVEGNNLCYVPPCILSGSSSTGYKHVVAYDENYSGGSGDSGYIWIPSSSTDHHIYYTTANGYVYRTKQSYAWSGGSQYVDSGKSGFIWMTPSTSSRAEQEGYNYLCYIDGGGYKRRLGVGEIT